MIAVAELEQAIGGARSGVAATAQLRGGEDGLAKRARGVDGCFGAAILRNARRREDPELQADCLAGVWGYSTYERGILESGDLEEGLEAAAAIGDDRIQEQATGSVNPDSWTHGSSEQRVKWFRRGFDSGEAEKCDAFAGGI